MGSQRVVRVAAYGVLARPGPAGPEVLLVRASIRSDVPGTWWLPGGGVEFGESPERAVVREVAEETGLTARVVGAPVVVSDVMDVRGKGVVVHSVRLCYPLELVGGAQRPEVDGTSDDLAWVALAEVGALPTLPFVPRALHGLGPELVGGTELVGAFLPDGAPPPDEDTVLVVEAGRVRVEARSAPGDAPPQP
ncbi:NUDIX domain-containing protein [Cellulomonas sp. DKR-3]|uniref:NUDIX domain-containing protein n=1 Tax=Cellulomonas fulva TaxID=2835530 RepID=A0ABS5U2U9_9CELL|nr:NUDIX domain-containing protein [Cellulomonas fulva]MBT0995651.1 NUDIX domain-containing protein [Cellulomonas fulva]